MTKQIPLKIGSCYKLTDGLTIETKDKRTVHLHKNDIILLLGVYGVGEKIPDSPWAYPWSNGYTLKLLANNQIGWWTFTYKSHAHILILENKLLEEIKHED